MKSPDDFHRRQASSHVPRTVVACFSMRVQHERRPRTPSYGRYRRAITMDLHDVFAYQIQSRETRERERRTETKRERERESLRTEFEWKEDEGE